VSMDGKHIVSGSWDETVRVWDLSSGEGLRTLVGHSNSVYAVAVTADGKHIVSGSYDRKVRVWELSSGEELHTLVGYTRWSLRSDGKLLLMTLPGWLYATEVGKSPIRLLLWVPPDYRGELANGGIVLTGIPSGGALASNGGIV